MSNQKRDKQFWKMIVIPNDWRYFISGMKSCLTGYNFWMSSVKYSKQYKISTITIVVQLLSCIWLFVTPWTVATRLLCPWGFLNKNTEWVAISFSRAIFPTQGSNPGLMHCRQILYHMSHQAQVFLPGKSHGQRSLVGYNPWGCKELNTTEWLSTHVDCNPPGFSQWDSLGKNTGVGCNFLLLGIFLTQGLKSHLLHWQTDSLPLSHLGSQY